MFQPLIQFWQLKDLRKRVLVTLLILVVARILIFIPLPLIHTSALKQLFQQNEFLGFLNIFSGGGLENFSIITMGVGPYITASIIMQLLGIVIPSLEELQKEGDFGQRKINQYTRLLTLPLAIIQAYSVLLLLKQNAIITTWTPVALLGTLLMMAAGSMFLMWMGEIVTENGIGNGMSLLITLGILGAIPGHITSLVTAAQSNNSYTAILAILVITFLSIVFVIIINEAKRLVPVAYARRVRAGGSFGSVASHLPIKINAAGVVPIIFAIALLTMPTFIGQFFHQARTPWIAHFATWLIQTFQPNTITYNMSYFLLVFAFTFFYTFIIFKPDRVAENLQKQGGYIPGVRPGKETELYVYKVLTRLTLFGALFLALIAILPAILEHQFPSQSILLRGTSLLIVISVILETARQIQSQYIMRTYDAYNQS
jgi:preprotein translocase subunit SecY